MPKETMCKEEYKDFCEIKTEYRKINEQVESMKITPKEYREKCGELIKKLDALERKYDEVYENENA